MTDRSCRGCGKPVPECSACQDEKCDLTRRCDRCFTKLFFDMQRANPKEFKYEK